MRALASEGEWKGRKEVGGEEGGARKSEKEGGRESRRDNGVLGEQGGERQRDRGRKREGRMEGGKMGGGTDRRRLK